MDPNNFQREKLTVAPITGENEPLLTTVIQEHWDRLKKAYRRMEREVEKQRELNSYGLQG